MVVTATDSDAVARMLLNDLGGTDVEIVTASLEQAFMALTGGDPATDGSPNGSAPALDSGDNDLSSKELAR